MNAWFPGDEVHGEQADQINMTNIVPAFRTTRNRAGKLLGQNRTTKNAMSRKARAGDESLVSQLHRYFGGRAEVGAPPMLAGASFNCWVNPGVQVIYIKVRHLHLLSPPPSLQLRFPAPAVSVALCDSVRTGQTVW